MKEYIIALDQGTSSSRAIVFNKRGEAMAVRQKEFTQHFPKPGMVEHDPMEIWATEYAMMTEAVTSLGLGGADIAAIGITNQRRPLKKRGRLPRSARKPPSPQMAMYLSMPQTP